MSRNTQLLFDEMVVHLPKLRRFSYGLTGSIDRADDLVQRTYERAFKHNHQYKKDSRLDSWLFRIMQSIHYNDHKAIKVRGGQQTPVDPNLLESPRGTGALESAIDLETVNAKILELCLEQREAILLVVVEGLSYQESADTLGIPIGTLTSRLARARINLSKLLD